jgi:hypothetical protein
VLCVLSLLCLDFFWVFQATGDLQQQPVRLPNSSGTGNALLSAATAASATVLPDDMAACQIVPGSEWILAKVVEHDPIHGLFKLADEDVESNKSTYCIVVCCPLSVGNASFFKGTLTYLIEFFHFSSARPIFFSFLLSSQSLTCPMRKSSY